MKDRLGKAEFAAMFAEAAKRIREQHALLTELDSIAGDGDHGTTMLRVADKMETGIRTESLPAFLKNGVGCDGSRRRGFQRHSRDFLQWHGKR